MMDLFEGIQHVGGEDGKRIRERIGSKAVRIGSDQMAGYGLWVGKNG